MNNMIATIIMEDNSEMEFELYYKKAPITVANFVDLANAGFYNGLSFHRVVKDFVIQGGSEDNTCMKESDFHIVGEFEENNINTGLNHIRGTLSMARDYDLNTAGTQFFVVHKDAFKLDGKYAAFGMLLNGFDVLDKIAETKVEPPEKENRPIKVQRIKTIKINTNGLKLKVQRLL